MLLLDKNSIRSEVILVGGFIEIIELCEENGLCVKGIIDNLERLEESFEKIIGTDNDAKVLFDQFKDFPLIITPDLPQKRKDLVKIYKEVGYKFYILTSKYSNISKYSTIGIGTIIQYGVNIASKVQVGNFVKINTMANIMHHTTIGNFCTIAPNAVILGYVKVGKECYIGANSTILPNVTITDRVIIGAGAVVTKDIMEPGSVYAGIPAKRIN